MTETKSVLCGLNASPFETDLLLLLRFAYILAQDGEEDPYAAVVKEKGSQRE